MPDFATTYDCEELAAMAVEFQAKFDAQLKTCERLLAEDHQLGDATQAAQIAAKAAAGGPGAAALAGAAESANQAWRDKNAEMNAAANKLHDLEGTLERIAEARTHCQPPSEAKVIGKQLIAGVVAFVASIGFVCGGFVAVHKQAKVMPPAPPVIHIKSGPSNNSDGSTEIKTGSADATGNSGGTYKAKTVHTPVSIPPKEQSHVTVDEPRSETPVVEPEPGSSYEPSDGSDSADHSYDEGGSYSNTGGNDAVGNDSDNSSTQEGRSGGSYDDIDHGGDAGHDSDTRHDEEGGR